MNPILECKGLTRKFNHFFALSNVDLTLERGEIIGLLGPNGSGKTTLIKLINGLLLPTDGQITVNGSVPGVETKKIVSYLPERGCLDERRRISELISYYSDFYSDFDVSRAHTMLKDLDIDPSLRLKTLSKGTKEKVQLILVMSRNAQLYVLDEPIGGVDPANHPDKLQRRCVCFDLYPFDRRCRKCSGSGFISAKRADYTQRLCR